MIPTAVRTEIEARLAEIERTESVRILLAIESGSRAWGFASPDSDFDVRFIYARSPEWYLSIDMEDRRDVLEYGTTDEIDLNGWDIRKALRLFSASNPGFIEWMHSPIRYKEAGLFASQVMELLPEVYVLERGIYHYRSMAKSNHATFLRGAEVKLKKYLYVLRPLLCVRWIEQFREVAPMEFQRLLALLEDQPVLLQEINELVARKKASSEVGTIEAIPAIGGFIEKELARLDGLTLKYAVQPTAMTRLNDLFRKTITASN